MSDSFVIPDMLRSLRSRIAQIPVLPTRMLISALYAKCADEALKGLLLSELLQRCWLFPNCSVARRQWFPSIDMYLEGSAFSNRVSLWIAEQVTERTYTVPVDLFECAANPIEKEAVQRLKSALSKWNMAEGVIAFVAGQRLHDDILLPFNLSQDNNHTTNADFGRTTAVRACRRMQELGDNEDYYLNFPTMGASLPGDEVLTGKSGALAIWFAILMKLKGITCKALDVGLSAAINADTDHISFENNQKTIIERKAHLFRRASVAEVILPAVNGEQLTNAYAKNYQWWPHSELIYGKMKTLVSKWVDHFPASKQLMSIQEGLVYGFAEFDIEEAPNTLKSMRRVFVNHANSGMPDRILGLLYICWCKLGKTDEAVRCSVDVRQANSHFHEELIAIILDTVRFSCGEEKYSNAEQMLLFADELTQNEATRRKLRFTLRDLYKKWCIIDPAKRSEYERYTEGSK